MRDLMVLGFTLVFFTLSVRNTSTAYLLWGWAVLMSGNAYLYGFMAAVPYVQLFALITLLSLVVRKEDGLRNFQTTRTTKWFIVFVFHGLLCALFAYPGLTRNWELFGNVFKTVLFCALMPLLVTNRNRLHAILVIFALAISFHGITDGLKFLASGSAHRATGIAKFGDNNHYALVLLMALPLLNFLFQYSAMRITRWGFGSAIFLTVLAVVATGSRGGLLGLFALAAWLVLKSRRKMLGMVVVSIFAVTVMQLAPDSWSERMGSIKVAEQDASFMSRVTAWKVSSAIAVANPVFGGGFRAVQSHPVWAQFKDSPGLLGFIDTPVTRSGVAAHSIWFEVLGDLGFVGFFIFVGMLFNGLLTLSEVNRLVKRAGPAWQWAADLANMMGATLFVYVVSGSALSAAYFEWPYIVMMLLEVINQLLRKTEASAAQHEAMGKHA